MGMMEAAIVDEDDDEDADEMDRIFQIRQGQVEPATEATRSRELPTWAANYQANLLGLMPFTRCHFFAVMAVGSEVDEEQADGKTASGVIEVLVDTGGARTVADRHTCEKLGLKIDRVECGSYWGIAATPVSYYGRVAGPVPIRFSE